MSRTRPSTHPDSSGPDAGAPTPRARVLTHLERLLRGATAVGAGALLAWGSRAEAQRPPQVCDPLPPPVNCKPPESFTVERCVAQQTRWTKVKGTWAVDFTVWLLQTGSSRGPALPALSPPPRAEMLAPGEPALPVSFARVTTSDVTVVGATVESLAAVSNRIDVRLRPASDVHSITVSLPNPADRRDRFTVVLDVGRTPAEGLLVPVTLAPRVR
ncbi:MAG: hypothetical protein NTY02_03250 [Acidobacteria bacterium]|nr:hypothetical protein [Acidobacteriota bacterium]